MSTQERRAIRILPPHVVNRIAAGEVVERPASVVKELVENALDAGATRLDITVGMGGRNIRVADNGCGMHPDDAALAFFNHATSKIQDETDLEQLQTLGFRGEALASIGAISKLTCVTRRAEDASGTKVSLDEQGQPTLTESGCAPGTIMEVEELFYNTPARLKFLKRPQTEMGHIEETVQALALSHPEVRFVLTLNDKIALKTSGSGELKRTIEEVFGLDKDPIPLAAVTAEDAEVGFRLAGFTSTPGVMKSSKRWMLTFINGRTVRCGTLLKAIESAFESLLPHDKYPLCVLFLSLPAAEVDVNVHPTKREVRYASANTVFGFVRHGIRNSLEASGYSAALLAPPESAFSTGTFSAPTTTGYSNATHYQGGFSARGGNVSGGYAKASGTSIPATPIPAQTALSLYQPLPEADGAKAPSDSRFKVVGQLFDTYILLETAQGLMVVDQHIASERTFFEALSLNFTAESPDIQRLVTAIPMPVSPLQADFLNLHREEFARLGFLYELDLAAHQVQLSGLPMIFAGRDGMQQPQAVLEHLLTQLEETGEMKLDLDHLIATLSCHSAVRAGDRLSPTEMQVVVERWLNCQLPWTCPHGRPIAHTISKQELNKFFDRPSLPVSAG